MRIFFEKHFFLALVFSLLLSNCKDGGNALCPEDIEPSFGIFSETVPEKLAFDIDSFVGTFSGGGARIGEFVEDSVEKKEGSISLRATFSVDASRGGFAGWFVAWGDASQVADDSFTKDMSDYDGGGLTFWVKSPINLEVGIRSGNVSAGAETSKVLLSEFEAFKADDSWRQICIPFSKFKGSAPKADLGKIKVFFVVASNTPSGGTGGVEQTFWIDDVSWGSVSLP